MATLESSIKLHDNMSRTLHAMNNAISSIINSFEALQVASQDVVDPSLFEDMRSNVYDAADALGELEESFRDVADSQEDIIDKNDQMGDGFGKLQRWAVGLGALYKTFHFAKESMDLSDVQRSAEIQLQTVLANVGASADAYERLSKAASNIQGKGIYGDEAMIAGAAELATYVSDVGALEKMMGTLSNFAMGMSGGGAIDPKQMVQYATQLGKAANGSYDGLMKKGFALTEAQKEIIKNGSDMQKAMVLDQVIAESWQNLYENMSNTPEGRLIQFNNALGDMRETIGNKLYVAMDAFFVQIMNSMPDVQKLMERVGDSMALIASALGSILGFTVNVFSTMAKGWNIVAPLISAAAGAMIWFKIVTFQYAEVVAMATDALKLFNTTIMGNPLFMYLSVIFAVIAAFYFLIGVYNELTGASISATGIIVGAFYTMGAHIYNILAFVANTFVSLCDFLQNVFKDPLAAIYNLFVEIWNGVMDVVGQAVAQMMNIIGELPGFKKWKGTTARDFKLDFAHIEGAAGNSQWRFAYKDLGEAAKAGYDKGSSLTTFPQDPMQAMQLQNLNKIASNTADTAGNTAKMKDKMEMNDTDLKYLHDIAEREVLNRFTTAEIKLDMTNNNSISSEVDVDLVIAKITDSITESMQVAAEGIHA